MELVGGEGESPEDYPHERAPDDDPMWSIDDGAFLAQMELDDEDEAARVGEDVQHKRLAALGW